MRALQPVGGDKSIASVDERHRSALDTGDSGFATPALRIVSSSNVVTHAYVDDCKPGHREQAVSKILGASNTALETLASGGSLNLCRSIAISDQMHGVVRARRVTDMAVMHLNGQRS
jgi:hypothetical protein